jgi:HD-GYP domain-containing protein (c-di-GMP phosphodiesterase class II)
LNAVHPDDREFLQKSRKEALSGEKPYDFDHRIVLPSGEIRSVHEQGVAYFDKSGKAFRMVGTVQDITERMQAKAKLQETLDRLGKAFGGVIQVLSATTEMRDPYTAGHHRRSADLARAIGREMGLPEDQVEGLRLAGTIHDVGKIGIPADILSKPTRLSEIEFSLIQSHSQIGYDILAGIEFAWPIAKIVNQHHERMDGSGYPQGLKNGDILLESRILAVADVIEAMASHRPYRPSLGIEAALKEIEDKKGVLYDPAVVTACLALFRENRYVLKD